MVNNSALQPDQEAGIAAESSPVDNPAPSRTNSIGAWTLRLLLALLLLFGSEILLWIDPPGRAATDWLLLGVGYITLSAVLLDLAARYGIRNLYDVMALTALYALGVGLLLNPQIGLVNFPVEFMTYVMGAHSLLGLEMLGVFFFLTGGRNRPARRLLLGYSLWVGFYWGTWVRWSPSLSDWLVDEVSLTTMFTIAGAMLVVGGVLTAFSFRRAQALSAPDMLLSQNMQGISAAILAGIFALRLAEGQVNIGMVVLTLFVGVLCVGILWFQRPTKGQFCWMRTCRPNCHQCGNSSPG